MCKHGFGVALYPPPKVGGFTATEDKKHYIAFKKKRNLVDINVQKKSLKLWINKRFGELDDPKHLARNVAEVGHLGNGDYEVRVHDSKDLEYIMSLIKQTL